MAWEQTSLQLIETFVAFYSCSWAAPRVNDGFRGLRSSQCSSLEVTHLHFLRLFVTGLAEVVCTGLYCGLFHVAPGLGWVVVMGTDGQVLLIPYPYTDFAMTVIHACIRYDLGK